MGSWSEYCGLSQVTITSGTKCVFIALKKDNKCTGDSLEWLPAIPPLFGEYDDGGGIEDIEDTIGARIVKQHFGIDAEEFVNMLERHSIGCDSQLDKPLPKSIKDWSYMFVHRDVWDFMVSYTPDAWEMSPDNSYDMGESWLLEHIGFKYMGEIEGATRFKHLWKLGDVEIKSDGTWADGSIFYLKTLQDKGIVIPGDLKSAPKYRNWRLFVKPQLEESTYFGVFGHNGLSFHGAMIGLGRNLTSGAMWLKIPAYLKAKRGEKLTEDQKDSLRSYRKYGGQYSALEREYMKMIFKPMENAEFIDSLCDYIAIFKCMRLYSKTFEAIKRHVTPQCGEHEAAQALFEKFAEVNKSMIYEDEDEDED